MRMPLRRQLLKNLAASPMLGWTSPWAKNKSTPSMTLLVPASPGGGWDTTARELGQALLASQGASEVLYEVRSGAAGTIGLAQFAQQHQADSNALMVMGSVMIGGILTGKPPVTLDAVTPIARLCSEYNVIVVPADSPWRDMNALMAQFETEPGSIRWGGGSRGATEHIVLGLLAQALGHRTDQLNYVPFRGGGEAAAALLSGAVMAASSGISEFMPFIKQGLMRPLAVTSPQRQPWLTAVPALQELGLKVVFGNWRGVCGGPGLSPLQRQALIGRVEKAVRHPRWQDALRRHQWQGDWLHGEAFAQFVREDTQTMSKVMQSAGLYGVAK